MIYRFFLNVSYEEYNSFILAFNKFKAQNNAYHLNLQFVKFQEAGIITNFKMKGAYAICIDSTDPNFTNINLIEYVYSLNLDHIEDYLVTDPAFSFEKDRTSLLESYESACLKVLQDEGFLIDSIQQKGNSYIRCPVSGKNSKNQAGSYLFTPNSNLNYVNYVTMVSGNKNYSIRDHYNANKDINSNISYANFSDDEKKNWKKRKTNETLFKVQNSQNSLYKRFLSQQNNLLQLDFLIKVSKNDLETLQSNKYSNLDDKMKARLYEFGSNITLISNDPKIIHTSEYLVSKQVLNSDICKLAYIATKELSNFRNNNLKFAIPNSLVLPIFNVKTFAIQGLQAVNKLGKFILTSSELSLGVFPLFSSVTSNVKTVSIVKATNIFLTEGFATGASLRGALDYLELKGDEAGKDSIVLATFNAINLKTVAEYLSEQFPDKKIIIAGDNDIKFDENNRQKPNVGYDVFTRLSSRSPQNIYSLYPQFTKDEYAKGNSDWNDFFNLRGYANLIQAENKTLDKDSEQFISELRKIFVEANLAINETSTNSNSTELSLGF